jgi:hypothetical protein
MTVENEKPELFDQNKTYYEILGISSESSQKEIRDAYIRLAKQVHPDHNNLNERQMIELNHIYEVLSRPDKKKEYDERFVQEKVYDFSKTISENKRAAEEKPLVIQTRIDLLRILRLGLTVILICLIAYLVFYLAINIINFFTVLPDWLLKLVPTTM